MRAIKIDSTNKTVSEIELNDDLSNGSIRLKQMQDVVGGLIEKAYELDNYDTVYVNEEGFFGDPQFFFEIEGAHQPFAGDGLIVGYDPKDGDTVAAESSVAEIKAKVKFLSALEIQRKYGTID